jgi:hypothetical protein
MLLRLRRRAIFGVGAAVAALACTWIDPLDDISGPKPTAGAGDAAGDAVADAATDVVTERAPPVPFCDTQDASFCEDFDLGTDLPGARWSGQSLFQGTLSIASLVDAPSPPNVLVASVTVVDSGANIKAAEYKVFDVVPAEVHLEHDWRLDSPPAQDTKLSVLLLGTYELELLLGSDTIGLMECYTGGTPPCVPMPYEPMPHTANPWRHVRIDFQKGTDGGAGSVALSVDGTSLFKGVPGQTGDAAADFAGGKLTLSVGIFYTDSTERIEYAFDNVVLNYR